MSSTAVGSPRPSSGGRQPQTEEEEESNRRPLIVIVAVAVLLLLALAVGIPWVRSSGDDRAGRDTEPVAEASVTTTEVTLPIITPTDAALALYVAWQRGDTTDADRSATEEAAEQMAAVDTMSAAGLEFKGCAAPEEERSICTWERDDALLTMEVSAPAEGQPEVESVEFAER